MVHTFSVQDRSSYLKRAVFSSPTQIPNQCITIDRKRRVCPKQQIVASLEMAHCDNTRKMTFQHPFTVVVTGPSGSGKTEWTRPLFLSYLIKASPNRIIWCFGHWQPLYDELLCRFSSTVEFVHGIPDYINEPQYLDITKKNLIVFDDLMTEAKCDHRVSDLFTKGSHHRNLSVVYLTQNLFPQGKACRDIALNTQYLILFNNPIDIQQVATLARRIYPSKSGLFMKKFEQATSKPYGYLVVDLKSGTLEQNRLRTDIFEPNETERMHVLPSVVNSEPELNIDSKSDHEDDDEYDFNGKGEPRKAKNITTVDKIRDDDGDDDDLEDVNNISIQDRKRKVGSFIGPPGKRFKEDLEEERKQSEVWENRFKEPLRQTNLDQFKTKVNDYMKMGYAINEAFPRAANDELPRIRKSLRQAYTRFLIDYHYLKTDPVQQQIIQSAKKLERQHDMSVAESIRQAVKLRKDLFEDIWPNHVIGDKSNTEDEDEENDDRVDTSDSN